MDDASTEACTPSSSRTSPSTAESVQLSHVLQQDGAFLSLTSAFQGKLGSMITKHNKRGSTNIRCQNEDSAGTNTAGDATDNLAVTPIRLSDTLKRHLETDYVNVNKKRRLTRVPAEPNAITVLEDFVRHYGTL